MIRRNIIKNFLIRLLVIFILLRLSWPVWNEGYANYFMSFTRFFYATSNERYALEIEPEANKTARSCEMRAAIENRALMNADGSGPVRYLHFNAKRIGWNPLELFLALVLATPIPWTRRLKLALMGALCMHAFILLTLGVGIWNEMPEISLAVRSPFWKFVGKGIADMLVSQASIVLPFLVWVILTFRREDFVERFGPSRTTRPLH